MPPNTSTKY